MYILIFLLGEEIGSEKLIVTISKEVVEDV